MLSRACDEKFRVPLLRVFRWMGKGLGTAPELSLFKIILGSKSISPHPSANARIFPIFDP